MFLKNETVKVDPTIYAEDVVAWADREKGFSRSDERPTEKTQRSTRIEIQGNPIKYMQKQRCSSCLAIQLSCTNIHRVLSFILYESVPPARL